LCESIIERGAGQSFAQVITTVIFKKAGHFAPRGGTIAGGAMTSLAELTQ
jgi:hypothetical protein